MQQLFLLTARPTMYIANVDEGASPTILTSTPCAPSPQPKALSWWPSVTSWRRKLSSWRTMRRRVPEGPGHGRAGTGQGDSRRLPVARPANLLHRWRERSAGVDRAHRCHCAEAAAVIHTDFQKGFIRAEVISYDDFVTYRGEQGPRTPVAGGWRARTTWCRTAT